MKLLRYLTVVLMLSFGFQPVLSAALLERFRRSEYAPLVGDRVFAAPSFNIKSIKELKALPDVAGAQALQLSGNDIKKIRKGDFDDPVFRNVRWLDLSNNDLQALEPGAFKGLEKLEVVLLDNNQLRAFKPGTFSNLKNLSHISVADNQGKYLRYQARVQAPQARVSTILISKKTLKKIIFGVFTAGAAIAATLLVAYGLSSKGEHVDDGEALSKKPPKEQGIETRVPEYPGYSQIPEQSGELQPTEQIKGQQIKKVQFGEVEMPEETREFRYPYYPHHSMAVEQIHPEEIEERVKKGRIGRKGQTIEVTAEEIKEEARERGERVKERKERPKEKKEKKDALEIEKASEKLREIAKKKREREARRQEGEREVGLSEEEWQREVWLQRREEWQKEQEELQKKYGLE